MQAVWTFVINITSRKYKNIDFERKLERDTPTTFKAQVEYTSPVIDFFDVVRIKRNGTTEWKGFVENINIEWDENGRWYNISGRDTLVIPWKKYGEEFQQYAEGIEGFFGKVKASELIKLILRTPRSDLPSESDDYKYNKMGWGLDASRIVDVSAARTSYGDPKWTILRKRGVAGWRNVGTPYTIATKTVTSALSTTNWTTEGASPYINSDDGDTSYIKSTSVVDAEARFQLDDLAGATGINSVHLSVKWKPDATWWWWLRSECWIYVSRDAGVTWSYVGLFAGKGQVIGVTPWLTYTYDVSNFFNQVSYLSDGNARIKFVNKSSGLATYITYTWLTINYSSGGTQDASDFFQATFSKEDIVGIYIESRADEESYPRNYDVVYLTDTLENYGDFSETDPNSHIALSDGNKTVTFDSYQNEDAYFYKDYGTNNIDAFDWKFGFKISSAQDYSACFVPFVVSNTLDDLKALRGNGAEYFTSFYVDCSLGELKTGVEKQDGGGMFSSSGPIISFDKTYYVRVVRLGTFLKYYLYSDASLSSDYLLWSKEFTLSSSAIRYRYRMQACTYNDASATHTLGYVYAFYPIEVTLVSVTNNTFRDIIHSWSPVNIGNIKIKITGTDAHAWIVTQIYIYKAETVDYRVMHEDASSPTFDLNQYIHSIIIDDSYATPIGPLNVPEGRITDQLNWIIDNLHSSYIPYEWYLEMDDDNTFHICISKGSDKSGTISFILGENLGGSTRATTLEETFQRVKIKGRGEGARSEEVSSGWKSDTSAMSDANTFFEEIKSEKQIVEKTVAELLSNIELKQNAFPKDQIDCKISKDSYNSMVYDVGDSVLINDSLIGINAAKRIYNIKKRIDSEGENINLYVGSPYKDVESTLKEIFDRIKSLEIGGGITGDWTDQARQSKISVTKLTTLFEKKAKEEELSTGTNTNDPKWKKTLIGVQGTSFELGDNGIAMLGATSGAQITSTVDYYYDIAVVTEELLASNDIEYLLTPKQNPKLEFEFKAYEKDEGENPLFWADGDVFDIGLAKNTAGYISGAWFRFLSIGSSQIQIFSVWRDVGEESAHPKYMMTISTNVKYRYIINYDYQRRWVTWEVWDVVNGAKYPLVAVRYNLDINDSQSVHPLFMELMSNYADGYRAQALMYHVKIEYERITEEFGEE